MDIVCPFDPAAVLLFRTIITGPERFGQRVDDRHITDTEPELPAHGPDQVFCLGSTGVMEQFGEQLDLELL